MGKSNHSEIEIKLSVSHSTMLALQKDIYLQQCTKQAWQQKKLINQYFDTADYALKQAKIALRIRQDNGQFIQTLKTKGNSTAGLSERGEFEWHIESANLDFSLLEGCCPSVLSACNDVMPVFTTNFVRDVLIIDYPSATGVSKIELALDNGLIQASQLQQPICEVELELKEGSLNSLLEFAIKLAKKYSVIPSDLSKAERGYLLMFRDKKPLNINACQHSITQLSDIQQQLMLLQQLFGENPCQQIDQAFVKAWVEQLKKMYEALQYFVVEDGLLQQLSVILNDWQELPLNDSEELTNAIMEEKQNVRWGVFSLSLLHWLLKKA